MPALKQVSEEQMNIVHEWLHTMGMPVNRHLHREYSDGILVAKLLKKMFPRYVDLHNYQSRFSRTSKIANWQTLNYKVLNRIGLRLTNDQSEMLARSEKGYIERLLWLIMNLTNDYKALCSRLRSPDATKRKIHIASPATKKYMGLVNSISKHSGLMSRTSDLGIKKSEKIGDSRKHIPYEVHENAISEIRDKVVALEYMLKERDNDIRKLLEHVKLFENKNKGLKKVVGAYKKAD